MNEPPFALTVVLSGSILAKIATFIFSVNDGIVLKKKKMKEMVTRHFNEKPALKLIY